MFHGHPWIAASGGKRTGEKGGKDINIYMLYAHVPDLHTWYGERGAAAQRLHSSSSFQIYYGPSYYITYQLP